MEKYYKNYANYYKKIIESDIINYSADGKYVIYGNKDGNTLSNTTTKTGVDLSDEVIHGTFRQLFNSVVASIVSVATTELNSADLQDLQNFINDYADSFSFVANPHKSRLDNGILYLGGDGDDTITGTDKADIFKGGSGYDKYFVSDGDTIEDDDKGQGFVYFNSNSPLTGGTYDKDKGCYVGGIYEYHLNGKTLIVKDTTKDESITL